MQLHIVILAAGQGTRMKSVRPKVLHRAAGLPLIEHVLATATALRPMSTTVVVGHGGDALKSALAGHPDLTFVVQEPQLGTGHALMMTESQLAKTTGTLLLLYADVPALPASTAERLLVHHVESGAAATVLTAVLDNPAGYGRIVRSGERIARIVEERDATSAERAICEINSGIYAFTISGLFETLRTLAPENAQREYYLTDLVAILRERGKKVETVIVSDPDDIRGVNSRADLAAAARVLRDRKAAELMAAGVTIEDPATAYIDRDVTIGADTIIRPGVAIEGRTTIGSGCEIHSGVRIIDSRIGDRVTILNHTVIVQSSIADEARVGPFAHLRPDSDVRRGARVGNFVEMKKTVLGEGSKSNHLSYLGDATIGAKVNIGAGTITCNYDGVSKKSTTIEDGAFIGSDTQLIAPVTIGKNAYVGSGTTIREDVPPGALAVSAGKQRNIDGWVDKKKVKSQKSEVKSQK
jgi:bifunctional UDP-N-acetylglucosamine pyrophosphorylase/glucosamine-1-phosphate N-acetyltransferase